MKPGYATDDTECIIVCLMLVLTAYIRTYVAKHGTHERPVEVLAHIIVM